MNESRATFLSKKQIGDFVYFDIEKSMMP